MRIYYMHNNPTGLLNYCANRAHKEQYLRAANWRRRLWISQ